MRSTLHRTLLVSLALLPLSGACSDEDGHLRRVHDAGADAGSAGRDAGPAVTPGGSLPRPGLARPPRTGLPPELRPPR